MPAHAGTSAKHISRLRADNSKCSAKEEASLEDGCKHDIEKGKESSIERDQRGEMKWLSSPHTSLPIPTCSKKGRAKNEACKSSHSLWVLPLCQEQDKN